MSDTAALCDDSEKIQDGSDITVSCAEGDTGFVYDGKFNFDVNTIQLDKMPDLDFKINLNVGNPDRAFDFQFLPNYCVGLARLEFIINHMIGIHPKAILNYDTLDAALQAQIKPYYFAYGNPKEYFIERLKEGIATIAAAFYPKCLQHI